MVFLVKVSWEWKYLWHQDLWQWAWPIFIQIRRFARGWEELSTPFLCNRETSPAYLILISINTLWDSRFIVGHFSPHRLKIYFNIVMTLTVKLSECRKQISFSTRALLIQLQRALSSADLLFISPFYLKLSTIFLHSESDSPRYPGDKWECYCLQAVHGASGALKKWIFLQRCLLS